MTRTFIGGAFRTLKLENLGRPMQLEGAKSKTEGVYGVYTVQRNFVRPRSACKTARPGARRGGSGGGERVMIRSLAIVA